MPSQTRKTVISKPVKHRDLRGQTPSKRAILDAEKEKKQWNKTANSIGLIAKDDVKDIIDNAKKEVEEIRNRIAKSITDILHVPECSLVTKAEFTKQVLSGLDVHQMLSLHNRLVGFERRIRRDAK